MKKIKLTCMIALVSTMALMSGCRMFGLDLQKPYKFDSTAGSSNQLNMNGWEFIESRSDIFEYFIEAVNYAGVDHEIFNRKGITIFPPTNDAINRTRSTATTANQPPGGYWDQHKVNGIKPDKWADYDNIPGGKEQVRQFVLNHVMVYAVSFNEFLAESDGARTFYPTMATNGYGYISLHMLTFAESPDSAENGTRLWVNDFPSHYTKTNPSGQAAYIYPRTSNLQTKNGSYVHVMDHFLEFPIDSDLEGARIYNK